MAALSSRTECVAVALKLGVMPDKVRAMDPIDAGALVALLIEQTERDALRREFDG